MTERFIIQYNELPVSVNNYMRPSGSVNEDGEVKVHMYETPESKAFKKRFRAYLKKEVIKQKWDKEVTSYSHWYLDCIFYQARTNSDNSNYYKILCDALTGVAIMDDKNVLVRTQRVMYDAKNPRFIAILKEVDYRGVFRDDRQKSEFIETNCMSCKKNSDKCSILKKSLEGRVLKEVVSDNGNFICISKKHR